ncbi:MAG: cell division protein FtsK [Rhodospirillaceae bacterium]|nr:cell division protein FtsK [Rhodospirillaceae bacterium]
MYENEYIPQLTFKKKILLIFFGLILFILSIFISLSSLSFNFNETGWQSVSNLETQNIFGQYGSYVSGFLLKEFGILTPMFLSLILMLYGFKYLRYQVISNFWFKLILMIGLLLISGILSQSIHEILNMFLSQEHELLNHEGFSTKIYKSILLIANQELHLGGNYSFILVNLLITLLFILSFIYIASTKIKELLFLKKITEPFYLPLVWIYQLLSNLLIRELYFQNNNDEYFPQTKMSFFSFLKSFIYFNFSRNKKIKPKTPININKSDKLKSEKLNIKKTINNQRTLPLTSQNGFILPSTDLLVDQKISNENPDDNILNSNAKLLEGVLKDYSIEGSIETVQYGPVVTRYDLKPAPGLRSQRVISLSDDIARSMLAESVRVAMVPGKNVIGVELPNKKRQIVALRHLLEDEKFQDSNYKLPLCLGKDIAGKPVIADLSTMPHLLIAGTTGSGKSVGVNSMIISLLYKHTPETCRFIMIDPKMLELSVYDGIPHLLTPVVTDPKKAITALKWAVREMENRYSLMSKLAVRNIENYNERLLLARKKGEILNQTIQVGFDSETGQPIFEEKEIDLTPLPFIVILIDEVADLMLVAGKEIEAAVQRLAQMARAAGIHVVMATQRPSVDVITGTIKANFPTRISFQVTSKIDSRTILGEQGAEQLLGKGDMLFMAGGGKVIRVHGPFLDDTEVEKVTSFLTSQSVPDYDETVTEEYSNDTFENGFDSNNTKDELYDEAVKLVIREQKASTSFIQRYFRIGYNRAATIIEKMEENNIISKPGRAGKRDIISEK